MADEVVDANVLDELLTASRAFVAVSLRSIDAARPTITVPQHRLLVLLAAGGARAIGELAQGMNVNSSNATRHCDRLERKGLVTRTRSDTDGRAVRVSLTTAGRDVIGQVTVARRADLAAVVGAMARDDRDRLAVAVRSFTTAAGELPDREWSSS